MDNNKVKLSNLKYYPNIEKLLKVQEYLESNKIIQDAKAKNKKCESYTAVNPII